MNAFNTPQCRDAHHAPDIEVPPHAEGGKRPRNQPPSLYMPAMPPLGLIDALEGWIVDRARQWRRRREFRRQVANLLAHDDRILADLGLERDEIEQISRLPLKEDACRALLDRQADRRPDSA
ncbi:DUF1127 domain-containing protein [Halomonas elongata]|uniref:DUF1127 domain protein n=1 Tax=Halomonas elongata (strain ATCC 33173 / DSM 2581 / NBRC 15536 / NCIMB 2198 / 1H9) TaxID=768066 RepID=E1V5D1_HALED|nr:DUF1127 domain-containing protein [Halomonas elongata]WBF16827.1 DUF1127 domain-containing protein [Halomonas elongata]WPU45658.1 DUF1127 domain-containing protein [Halomonas elongata DSM 2581]CBV43086.1 DUF1127 domain protein [Halomonas elongata DSM 2581]